MEQYEAFLARELPRKVRKELEKAMESLLGPIEETLKNHLENIVRNCQENLSKTYQESIHSSQTKLPEDTNISMALNDISYMPQSDTSAVLNDLAAYAIPPEALMDFTTEAGPSYTAPTTSSDSAYYSESQKPDTEIPDDALWPIQFEEMTGDLAHDVRYQYTGMISDSGDVDVLSTFINETPSQYSGKGKARADPFVDELLS